MFSLSNVSGVKHFVARTTKLTKIHKVLSGDGSRHVVVLHDLGEIDKILLAIIYTIRHKDDYSGIF